MTTNLGNLAGRFAPVPEKPANRVILNPGHGGNANDKTFDPGCTGADSTGKRHTEASIVEDFVYDVANKVASITEVPPIIIAHGGAPAMKYWAELINKVRATPAEFVISYHCNSAADEIKAGEDAASASIRYCTKQNIQGHETLYAKGSTGGFMVANALNRCTYAALKNPTRANIAIESVHQRGGGLIVSTPQIATLHELAFIPNTRETDNLLANWDKLVGFHAQLIVHLQLHGLQGLNEFQPK